MTMQRYDFYRDPVDPIPMNNGRYVLAAAAETAIEKWRSLCFRQGSAYDEGVEWGKAEAIDEAVQRVKDYLQHDVADGWMPQAKADGIIATIRGEG